MINQQLFLFGGGPPFTSGLCKTFVSCSNGKGPIVLLYVPRPGSSWADYAPIYTDALTSNWCDRIFPPAVIG